MGILLKFHERKLALIRKLTRGISWLHGKLPDLEELDRKAMDEIEEFAVEPEDIALLAEEMMME